MNKILFVEDDALIARIYRQKLVAEGFEVALAEDGLVALKRLPEFLPDLVVLDLMMPRLSGLDVLKFMRRKPEFKSTRVIVFSNAFLNKLGEEVAALGVDEMLVKAAVTPALLVQTIRRILSGSSGATEQPAPAAPPAQAGQPPGPPPPPIPQVPPLPVQVPPVQAPSSSSTRVRIQHDFFEQIPAIIQGIRQSSGDFLEGPLSGRPAQLLALNRKMNFFTHMTGLAGCHRLAQLSSALEALLFEIGEKPAYLTESCRRTIASAVQLLTDCLARAAQADDQCLSPTTILLVDDDVVSNRAVVMALKRASLIVEPVLDPVKALERLRQNSYDLVLLDVELPGTTGLVLCGQMRSLPLHKTTPVIFFTVHLEFEAQARALLGPGDDWISKPIPPVELTVKVIVHLLRRRLQMQKGSG